MFIIFLKFSDNKKLAGSYMEEHNKWIKKGIEDNQFMIIGSLQPNQGGCIIATSPSFSEVEQRVKQDPFVEHNIVQYEIHEFAPSITHKTFDFLLG